MSIRDEVAKERFLDIAYRNPTMDNAEAARLAVASADALMTELRKQANADVALPRLKGCSACYGSGGKVGRPCKVCNGSGKVPLCQ
jgi:DnaJ-class molecular chaperone